MINNERPACALSTKDFYYDLPQDRIAQTPLEPALEPCMDVRQLAVHEDSQILALLEDGLFDRQIWFPAALFAAALWDCGQSIDQLIHETALRPDVVFA